MLTRVILLLATASIFSLPASDSFSRCTATLGTNWTDAASGGAITDWTLSDNAGACAGSPVGAVNAFAGSNFDYAYWNADSFANDQYSQVVVTKGTNGYVGVAVRVTSLNAYLVTLDGGTCNIRKFVSGTRSDIGSCSVTWTDGHTLKLQAIGTAITAFDNGVSIGTATDSDLVSGSGGIVGYADTGGQRVATWEGGNTGGGGPTFPGAVIGHAPIKCCKGVR